MRKLLEGYMNQYMKNDVKNIFRFHPDLTEDEFLGMVLGNGDEGYDVDSAAEMWEYYQQLSSGKDFNEDASRSGRKLTESESNLYYFGICCYEKKDTKHDYPCFLAIGKEGDFVPVGWSFWEIIAGSKFVKGESENDPTYGSKTAKMMTLNDLWVECHTKDPSKNPEFDPSNFLMRLEKVFPDFDFYATVYPKSKMDAYYDYKDGPATEDLPADLEAAYMRLNDKLQNVELKEKSSWSFPF